MSNDTPRLRLMRSIEDSYDALSMFEAQLEAESNMRKRWDIQTLITVEEESITRSEAHLATMRD